MQSVATACRCRPLIVSRTQFELIAKGGLEFDEASTELDAKISGRFYGTLFSFGGGEDTVAEAGDAEAGAEIGLVINEVAAQGDPLDWFELYNASDESIDLADFVMADDLTDEGKRTSFPAAWSLRRVSFYRSS